MTEGLWKVWVKRTGNPVCIFASRGEDLSEACERVFNTQRKLLISGSVKGEVTLTRNGVQMARFEDSWSPKRRKR